MHLSMLSRRRGSGGRPGIGGGFDPASFLRYKFPTPPPPSLQKKAFIPKNGKQHVQYVISVIILIENCPEKQINLNY